MPDGTYLDDQTQQGPGQGQQQQTVRPGMYDDIVGPSSSPSPDSTGSVSQDDPYADIIKPTFFQRVGAALRGYLPQPGEGVLHTAGRDVEGLGEGLVKPFNTLSRAMAPSAGMGGYVAETPEQLAQRQAREPSKTEVAEAIPQAALTFAAGPLEGAIAERLGGGLAARVIAGAGVGAGAGAVFNPQDPGVGAVLGAGIGAPLGSLHAVDMTTKVMPDTPFAEPPKLDDLLSNVQQNAQEMMRRGAPAAQGGNGGFSFDPRTGKFLDQDGFFVGMGNDHGVFSRTGPNAIPDGEQAGQSLQDVISKNPELFQRGNVVLGGWYDSNGLHVEPSQVYNDINPAFMSAYERGQVATGGFIDGDWHEVPTQGPEAQRIYDLAKQSGRAPTQIQQYLDAIGEQGNSVSAALERIGSAAKAAQGVGAAAGAAGVGAASSQGTGVLQRLSQGESGAGGNSGGDVPPGGGTPPPPGEPPAGSVGGNDEGSRPGPSGYGFTQDEEADLLGQYLNLNKFQVSGDAQKAVLRLALQKAITDNGITGKLRIGWEQTLAGAKHVLDSMSPQEVAALGAKQVRESGVMTRAVSAAHTLLYRRLTQQVEGLGTAIRDKNIPINQAHELTDKLNQVVDDQTQIAANMVRSHSEYGRQLNSLKIAASQTTDPTYWLLRASKMRDGAPLSADEQMEITGALNKITTATDAFQRTKAQNLLAAKVAGMKYLSAWQKGASIYRANLLSSPSSLIGAALGHASFAALDAADKNLAGFYDMLIGSVTGQRTTSFAPLADMRARFRGMASAARDVPDLIRSGESTVQGVVDQADKDWGIDQMGDKQLANGLERITDPLLRGGNVTFGVWSKMILRMYGVVPHVIKGGAMEASLESQARLAAMGENLGGKLLEQRVQQLRTQWRQNGLPEQVQRQMIEDGSVAALTNQGYLAYGTSMVKRGAESAFGAPGRFVADAALPFTTVPSNLIEQGLKHSPFAGGYGAARLGQLFFASMKGSAQAAIQKAAVDNLARASTGAGAMLAGYLLAKAGMATGPADDNDRRQVAIMTGRQPDAIRLGSEWYNDSRFAPISSLVELGVYYHDMLNDPRQITSTTDPNASQTKGFLEGTANAYAQSIKDAPFAQGIKYISDAITEPGNALKNYGTEVARGVVPTVAAHTEAAMDPYVRQPEGLAQTIEARIPIPAVYNRVPVRPNPLGLPTTHETGVVAGFTPYPATADQTLTDPVMKAISDSRVNLPAIKRVSGETDDQYNARVGDIARMAYAGLQQLVTNPGWQEIDQQAVRLASDPRSAGYTPAEIAQHLKQELIQKVMSQAKSKAARATSPRARVPELLRDLVNPTPQDSSTPNE